MACGKGLSLYLYFLWGLGVIAGYKVPQQDSQCTLQDGKCSYYVSLSPSCNSLPIGNLDLNTLAQNDYTARVNEIEKNLVDVRADHAHRIQELENTISTIVNSQGGGSHKRSNVIHQPGATREHKHIKHDPTETHEDRESRIMAQLHSQFSLLRHELNTCKRNRRETEHELNDTKKKLTISETSLLETTNKLLHTERELDTSRDEGERLSYDLSHTEVELNSTLVHLQESKKKLRKNDLELWDLRMDNERLKKVVRDLREELDLTRLELANALRKYHELNLRHEEAVLDLQNKTEQLVTCTRGKTSQFCGFEDENVCGFEQENATDHLDWIRQNMHTPSARTGPSVDHTCRNQNGYYMYVEASSRATGQTAMLVSPKYQGLAEQCVEFYYHMYGRHTGTLNVYTRISDEEFIQAWRAYGNQGNVWTNARLPIPTEVARKGYQIIFEGILEKGFEGDIAVDDFRVFDGPCYVKEVTSANNTDANNPASSSQDSNRFTP